MKFWRVRVAVEAPNPRFLLIAARTAEGANSDDLVYATQDDMRHGDEFEMRGSAEAKELTLEQARAVADVADDVFRAELERYEKERMTPGTEAYRERVEAMGQARLFG